MKASHRSCRRPAARCGLPRDLSSIREYFGAAKSAETAEDIRVPLDRPRIINPVFLPYTEVWINRYAKGGWPDTDEDDSEVTEDFPLTPDSVVGDFNVGHTWLAGPGQVAAWDPFINTWYDEESNQRKISVYDWARFIILTSTVSGQPAWRTKQGDDIEGGLIINKTVRIPTGVHDRKPNSFSLDMLELLPIPGNWVKDTVTIHPKGNGYVRFTQQFYADDIPQDLGHLMWDSTGTHPGNAYLANVYRPDGSTSGAPVRSVSFGAYVTNKTAGGAAYFVDWDEVETSLFKLSTPIIWQLGGPTEQPEISAELEGYDPPNHIHGRSWDLEANFSDATDNVSLSLLYENEMGKVFLETRPFKPAIGDGIVNPVQYDPEGGRVTAAFPEFTTVRVVAVPYPGYEFVEWVGADEWTPDGRAKVFLDGDPSKQFGFDTANAIFKLVAQEKVFWHDHSTWSAITGYNGDIFDHLLPSTRQWTGNETIYETIEWMADSFGLSAAEQMTFPGAGTWQVVLETRTPKFSTQPVRGWWRAADTTHPDYDPAKPRERQYDSHAIDTRIPPNHLRPSMQLWLNLPFSQNPADNVRFITLRQKMWVTGDSKPFALNEVKFTFIKIPSPHPYYDSSLFKAHVLVEKNGARHSDVWNTYISKGAQGFKHPSHTH